ncbi:unnamed protein product, partial [Mesorhabditis spiculigera]
MDASDSDFDDLIGFLAPETRLDIRRTALQYVLEASTKMIDNVSTKFYLRDDAALGNALLNLVKHTSADRKPCFAALCNFASISSEIADHVLKDDEVMDHAWKACVEKQPSVVGASRLLANLARHFPSRVHTFLERVDANFLQNIVENLHKITPDSPQPYLESLAWTLVNLTTLHGVRRSLVDKAELLDSIYAIARQDANKRIKESGVDVLRNLCFDEALHDKLLDDKDHFLVALLTPLADEQDALDDEEIEKLPLALQYYEGSRESVPEIRQKLVEALYQLCSTKHGRCSLRKKGAYALLRELDKATSEKPDPNAPPPKMKPPTLLAQEEHTLHALIGILIRYEEDLGIDTEAVHSLKQLE